MVLRACMRLPVLRSPSCLRSSVSVIAVIHALLSCRDVFTHSSHLFMRCIYSFVTFIPALHLFMLCIHSCVEKQFQLRSANFQIQNYPSTNLKCFCKMMNRTWTFHSLPQPMATINGVIPKIFNPAWLIPNFWQIQLLLLLDNTKDDKHQKSPLTR